MTLQEHMQICTSCLNASEMFHRGGTAPLPSPGATDPALIPHLPSRIPPTPTLHQLLQSGKSWVKYSLFSAFPSSPKNQPNLQQKTRILNLRRVIPITCSINTFSLLTADYKVFFNHVLQRKQIIFTSKEHTQAPLFFTLAINFVH